MASDVINENEIRKRLADHVEIFTYELIDSTSTQARRYALSGGLTPAVFVAESQSSGRGRCGRSFFSPKGSGLYLSLLVPFSKIEESEVSVTAAAAVAVRRAILRVTGASVGIKWVNDLYLDGKKVCGILAEAIGVNSERYCIVGVGVNLSTEDFPLELRATAGSIGIEGVRNILAAEIVNELFAVLLADAPYIEEYRDSSIVLGREIVYIQNGIEYNGYAEDVDPAGRLIVRGAAGERCILGSGEISLRLQ